MSLSPKQQRNLARILPFGLIWLITSWVFLLNDLTLSRNQNLNPETDITLTIPVIIFASIAIALIGLLVGTIEMILIEQRFRNFSLSRKVLYKFGLYFFLMLSVISITYPIASGLEQGLAPWHSSVLEKMYRFVGSVTFANTLLQLAFSLLISLFYAAVSENLGHHVLFNLISGRYHQPKVERRIFMFLDMKDSTTLAEQLGHVRYFDLLQAYYELMSEAIIDCRGEVYQYIGDEVVISWKEDDGFARNNCLRCFKGIKARMQEQAAHFEQRFGHAPDFKAGMHVGEVTTGEIGALKKEIVFTGDVLNTTARIQALCKEQGSDLIISATILKELSGSSELQTRSIGELSLRGKQQLVQLYAVEE